MQINRNAYYGLIHKGAASLLGLNQMLPDDADAVYRHWLKQRTSKTSCKDLTDAQLKALKNLLEAKGALPKPVAKAQQQTRQNNNPTNKQYKKLTAVVKSKGWSGLGAPELAGFIQRTTQQQCVSVYQLDRRQMSNVITGLEKWKV
ncbi:DUF1018 domain-containing protein [Pseudoalteromonas sp. JBTF-M23]|uniref:DUF1018 domain-containing protein n=1 Tax=Pseudoalteromonas caenipelagi TaxID=2726988 RepID=A0A849VE35_9GAMM|nr:phage protein GemA/Gp16 family protein [Pseudoalteromonas caenipelagi]NOU49961.1 DUF1018 domain-containing protein [Pseudoalteromonas caenipelagi]